jgi:hypothetical protein
VAAAAMATTIMTVAMAMAMAATTIAMAGTCNHKAAVVAVKMAVGVAEGTNFVML